MRKSSIFWVVGITALLLLRGQIFQRDFPRLQGNVTLRGAHL